MKTAKAVIEKSVWALVLGLGLVLAAQAQPADSTGAGRVISSQGTISSSSGTTGTYQPPNTVRTGRFANSRYQPWTLSFQGTRKCGFVNVGGIDITLCARITNDDSGNVELYQPADIRLGNDMRSAGWFESANPGIARNNWPNWPVGPETADAALKTIYPWGSYITIQPILGASGLASDWLFSYRAGDCISEANRWETRDRCYYYIYR